MFKSTWTCTTVCQQDNSFFEGPAICSVQSPCKDNSEQVLFFSDIFRSRVLRTSVDGNKLVEELDVRLEAECNGLAVTSTGLLFACEIGNQSSTHRLIELDCHSKEVRVLADSHSGGVSFNSPNDLAVDHKGGVYFTDPNMPLPSSGMWARAMAMVRLSYMLTVQWFLGLFSRRVVATENVYYYRDDVVTPCLKNDVISKPNGIALSNDGKTLYIVESSRRGNAKLWAFSIETAGKLANPKSVALPHTSGDGMAVRPNNQLFVACKDEIVVFDEDLKELHRRAVSKIDQTLKGYKPSNICFVGNDAMYVTFYKLVPLLGWVFRWSRSKLCKVILSG